MPLENLGFWAGHTENLFQFKNQSADFYDICIKHQQGSEYTNNQIVTLKLFAGSDTKKMAISNFPDFRDAGQEKYQTTKTWTLTEGEGVKTVYAKFFTDWGQSSPVVSDSIIYRIEKPTEEKPPIVEAPEIIKKIPETFKPKLPEEPEQPITPPSFFESPEAPKPIEPTQPPKPAESAPVEPPNNLLLTTYGRQ